MSRQEITSEHVDELSSLDTSGYWWYAVRQAHVEAQLLPHAGEAMALLDLGCGAGGVLSALTDVLRPGASLGLDGTQEAVDVARGRGVEARFADFRQPLELPFAPTHVTCLDVLEHLEDPVLALTNLAAACAPGATLVVTVPAMPSLHSAWDDLCGHHRRYTPALLSRHLGEGGWTPGRIKSVFSYCVPPAFWQRRVRKTVQEMEFPPVSPLVNRLLTAAGTVERTLGCPLPFGTTLLTTATRRG